MYKKYLLNLLFIFSIISAKGQSCEAYFPLTKGAVMELTSYNEKNKPQTVCTTIIQNVENMGNDVNLTLHADIVDEKNKPVSKVDYDARCSEGSFFINMKSLISSDQLKAWESMTVKIDANDVSYPLNCTAGQKLEDASLKVDVFMNDMKMPGMTINVIDRKVIGMESITTPAGTFECVKISATQKVKYIVGYEMHTIEWLSKGNGIIRSESYKGEKLKGYTLMTKLTK